MNIDIDHLICLMEAKPVLWGKTLEIYKDHNETKKAWVEIFKELNYDFESLDDKGKNDYGKEIMKKWANIRDSFQKCEKQQKLLKKSGSGKSTSKTYIYGTQLQFLKKAFQERSTASSLLTNSSEDYDEQLPPDEDTNKTSENYALNQDNAHFKTLGSRKQKPDPIEMELLQVIKENPDRHMSFFKGIIPSLNTFNEDEILEFQISLLQTIAAIKRRKNHVANDQPTTSAHFPQNNRHQSHTTQQTISTNSGQQPRLPHNFIQQSLNTQQINTMNHGLQTSYYELLPSSKQQKNMQLSASSVSENSYDSFDISS